MQEYAERLERSSSLPSGAGELFKTVTYSIMSGVHLANKTLFKYIVALIVAFGVMAFLIGVLLTIVYYK